MNPVPPQPEEPAPWWKVACGILFGLLISPALIIGFLVILGGLLIEAVWNWVMYLAFYAVAWFLWPCMGKSVLLVTSESQLWRDAIEERWIHRLGSRAYILNWSRRKEWPRWDLNTWAFRNFAMGRKYAVPMGIVVHPFKRARVFHFYKPFKQVRGGFHATLERLERQFLEAADGSA